MLSVQVLTIYVKVDINSGDECHIVPQMRSWNRYCLVRMASHIKSCHGSFNLILHCLSLASGLRAFSPSWSMPGAWQTLPPEVLCRLPSILRYKEIFFCALGGAFYSHIFWRSTLDITPSLWCFFLLRDRLRARNCSLQRKIRRG